MCRYHSSKTYISFTSWESLISNLIGKQEQLPHPCLNICFCQKSPIIIECFTGLLCQSVWLYVLDVLIDNWICVIYWQTVEPEMLSTKRRRSIKYITLLYSSTSHLDFSLCHQWCLWCYQHTDGCMQGWLCSVQYICTSKTCSSDLLNVLGALH